MARAVFLDRDGVINKSLVVNGKPCAPTSIIDFQLLPGVTDSLLILKDAGYLIVIVTNQPDLSTGKQTWESLNEIHAYLTHYCHVDLIKVCSHAKEDNCKCRKPNPGMIIDASNDLEIDISESYMIGDRWSDIEAGHKSGCKKTFFIDYGYDEKKPTGSYISVNSLSECAEMILRITT